jgi:hypothetical protein
MDKQFILHWKLLTLTARALPISVGSERAGSVVVLPLVVRLWAVIATQATKINGGDMYSDTRTYVFTAAY